VAGLLNGECDHTYHNEANSHYSLIDHFLVSKFMVNECQSVKILTDKDNPVDHMI